MRLRLVDQPGIQIGINRHLFTGHRVQRKAGGHLGDTFSTFSDHDKVDDHQDDKHHKADYEVTADHHLTEGLDHFTGGTGTHMAMQ